MNKKAEGFQIETFIRFVAWILLFLIAGAGVIYFFKRMGVF